jgi:hypothetical protein
VLYQIPVRTSGGVLVLADLSRGAAGSFPLGPRSRFLRERIPEGQFVGLQEPGRAASQDRRVARRESLVQDLQRAGLEVLGRTGEEVEERHRVVPRPVGLAQRGCDLAAVLAPGGEVGQKGEDDVRA